MNKKGIEPMRTPGKGSYLFMFAIAGMAGVFSSFAMGVTAMARGATLGLCLALGILLRNVLERKRLEQGHKPRFIVVLACAVLAGVLAGGALELIGMLIPWNESYSIYLTREDSAYAVAVAYGISLLYALLLFTLCHLSLFKKYRILLFVGVGLVGYVVGWVRYIFSEVIQGNMTSIHDFFVLLQQYGNVDFGVAVIVVPLLGSVPFVAMWFVAVYFGDPRGPVAFQDRVAMQNVPVDNSNNT